MLNASVHKPLLMITVPKTLDKGLMVIITRLPTVYDVHEHKMKFFELTSGSSTKVIGWFGVW